MGAAAAVPKMFPHQKLNTHLWWCILGLHLGWVLCFDGGKSLAPLPRRPRFSKPKFWGSKPLPLPRRQGFPPEDLHSRGRCRHKSPFGVSSVILLTGEIFGAVEPVPTISPPKVPLHQTTSPGTLPFAVSPFWEICSGEICWRTIARQQILKPIGCGSTPGAYIYSQNPA